MDARTARRAASMSTPPPPNGNHAVALWAGVSAFFASLLAVGIFDLFNAAKWLNLLSSIVVAAVTAGGVYAKQRLDDAKGSSSP